MLEMAFSFNNVMYRQIEGVAMGSPLGPLFTSIFVGFHEKKIPAAKMPEMYERYVDDIFSHFQSRQASEEFGVLLNNLHPALRFTCEHEEDDSLPYLDVRVTRTVKGMSTSIYRKPSFTSLYTWWDSYSATKYKINMVCALVHRILRICSPAVVEMELRSLRDIFLKKSYSYSILEK